jgi:hypothetical protein
MQKILFSAMAAAAVLASGAASAAGSPVPFRAQATLATPADRGAVVAGVTWKCEGVTCSAFAERHSTLDSQVKECRKVASALGPLASYRSRGREMSPGNLNVCNRAAASSGAPGATTAN